MICGKRIFLITKKAKAFTMSKANHIRAIANLARRRFNIKKGAPFWVDVVVTVKDHKWLLVLSDNAKADAEKAAQAVYIKLEVANVTIEVGIKDGQKEAILCEEIGYKYEG